MNPSPYDANSILANMSANQQQQPQQPAQPEHSGNWFTHLLPTIGGIGGSILGGIATAGLGGEVVGGAGGAALGKGLEHALEGSNPFQADDLTAAAEGGIGAGVGGVAGKVLGKAGEVLGNRAGNLEKAAADASQLQKEQQAGVDFANATKNNYGISSKLQGGDHLALGTNQKFLTSMGHDATDPYQMSKAAEIGYHPNDLSYNTVYDEALQGAKPVDMSDFGNQVFNTMKETGTTDLSKSPLGNALQDFHLNTKGIYGSDNNIVLPDNMAATDVRKLQQAIGKEMGHQQTIINNAENSGLNNAPAESAHATLSNLYDQLGSKIKTPEVDQAIAARVTTPEERQALIDKFGDKLGNHAADTIDNATSANDLLAPMRQTTQMSTAGRMGIDNIENKTGTGMAVARSKADLNGDGTADVPPQGQNIIAAAGDALNGGGHPVGMLAKFAAKTANSPTILNTLERVGKISSKTAAPLGAAVGTAANLGADPVAGATNTGVQTMQPPTNNLGNFVDSAEALSVLDPNHYGSMGQSVLALEPQLQKNQLLSAQLQGLPGLYANAGGAQGLPGILSHISGLVPGTAAHTYEAQQRAAAEQLGINPAMLPSLMQNGNTAGLSGNVLSQLQGQLVY